MRIVGIDPGSHRTGVGVVDSKGSKFSYVGHHLIQAKAKDPLSQRIACVYQELSALLAQIKPDVVVLESVFFGKNADSAFKLGHARGVCLLAAQLNGAKIFEVSAREVKKIITGSGGAGKEQVREQVCRWLKIELKEKELDVSDALSLAIAGSFEYEKRERLEKMNSIVGGQL